VDIDRMLEEGTLIVEWPERVRTALPEQGLWILMEHVAEEQRRIQFTARGERYDHLLERLQRAMFGAT
jgi:tRNA A37 threonylcarbamoyladenosine biosynthesis protein TsaE